MRDRKSNKAPSFTVMHFALLLLCAVLISSHATIGLYASYRSEATGSASASVAKFNVIAECIYNEAEGTYTWKVINDSDVTVSCSFSATIDGSPIDDSVLDYNRENEILPNQTTATDIVLKFKEDYTGELNIVLSVSQVD